MKPLNKMNKTELLEIAAAVGLTKVTKDTTNKTIIDAIEYKADEIDSMVTAKLNAAIDMPKTVKVAEKSKGTYLGKCPVTGKELHS